MSLILSHTFKCRDAAFFHEHLKIKLCKLHNFILNIEKLTYDQLCNVTYVRTLIKLKKVGKVSDNNEITLTLIVPVIHSLFISALLISLFGKEDKYISFHIYQFF